jgi:hypothetical protein
MSVLDIENMEIEIIPYDGTPNLRNPFDRLTPEERRKKIVEIYARIYLKMLRKKQHSNSNPKISSFNSLNVTNIFSIRDSIFEGCKSRA